MEINLEYDQKSLKLLNDINDLKKEYFNELNILSDSLILKQSKIEEQYINKNSKYKKDDLIFSEYHQNLFLITDVILSTKNTYESIYRIFYTLNTQLEPCDVFIIYIGKKINKNGKLSLSNYTFYGNNDNIKFVGTLKDYNSKLKKKVKQ